MKRYTSMKVGGPAPYLFYPEDAAGVAEAIGWLGRKKLPFRFLGKGTNVIVADRGIDMGIIRTTGMGHLRFRTTVGGALCDAGGGLPLKKLIAAAAARGLSGLEKLYGIPGTVGGAIKMNAGSFGAAVSDCLVSVVCVDEKGKVRAMQADEMTFGYRRSSIGKTECIVEATFRLAPGDRAAIEAEMDDLWRQRLEKHPMDLPSAGSVFRNESGTPAWTYIDRAGLRGFTTGRACVSAKHPNFIVNLGGASASDVLRLIETVKKGVREATGIELEEEVELWGFDGDA
jgi:UDP-N-acetylmuramate dehydrogenase